MDYIIYTEIRNIRVSQVKLVKHPPGNSGDMRNMGLIPGLERCPGGGHGSPLEYSSCRIPGTEEPGRLQTIGSQRVGHDWSGLVHMQETLPKSVSEVLHHMYMYVHIYVCVCECVCVCMCIYIYIYIYI